MGILTVLHTLHLRFHPSWPPKASFGSDGHDSHTKRISTGVCNLPETVLLTLIVQLRAHGSPKPADVAEESAQRFGGNFLDKANNIHDLTHESDVLANELAERLNNIDIHRNSPLPRPNLPAGASRTSTTATPTPPSTNAHDKTRAKA